MQSLESVGRSAGLERAAAQQVCAALFNCIGNAHYLFRRLDRAGAGYELEVAAAHCNAVRYLNNAVVRVELAIGLFERLGYARNAFNNVQPAYKVDIQRRSIAHEANNSLILAVGYVGAHVLAFEPGDEVVHFFLSDILFKYKNHCRHLLNLF